ncbi:MAG: cupredoxin domain-containing protein [Patescibacteria group bacterium]
MDYKNLKTILLLLALIIVLATAVIALYVYEKPVVDKTPKVTPIITNQPATETPVVIENAPIISTDGAKTEVVGASPVTPDDVVVAPSGQASRNDVIPGSENAPRQTDVITPAELPTNAVKLTVTEKGFSPKEFTVKAGESTTLSLTSGDSQTHILKFDSASLSAVAIGVETKQTRAITFNAPKAPGEYSFYCMVLGHASRGEVGKMIVK